jgi:hypothetical protein
MGNIPIEYVGTRAAIPKAIIIIIIGHGTFNALLPNTTNNSTVVMVIASLQKLVLVALCTASVETFGNAK